MVEWQFKDKINVPKKHYGFLSKTLKLINYKLTSEPLIFNVILPLKGEIRNVLL